MHGIHWRKRGRYPHLGRKRRAVRLEHGLLHIHRKDHRLCLLEHLKLVSLSVTLPRTTYRLWRMLCNMPCQTRGSLLAREPYATKT